MPTTAEPTTAAPTTTAPTTAEPTTAAPITAAPITAAPTTTPPTPSEPSSSSGTTPPKCNGLNEAEVVIQLEYAIGDNSDNAEISNQLKSLVVAVVSNFTT